MKESSQDFGKDWTEKKLAMIGKYLPAYTTALKNKNFTLLYIDAFAGTGYRTSKQSETDIMFPEIEDVYTQNFFRGSADIALATTPSFDKYIFIEKDEKKAQELFLLKEKYPDKASTVEIITADANTYLQDFCTNTSWKSQRAVLFLDPFGMEVDWQTIVAISRTEAIDLWLLFPLGIAINRLLRKDAKIDSLWREKLNKFFGTEDWFNEFYTRVETSPDLFDAVDERLVKRATLDKIKQYFIKRLEDHFSGVAKNPFEMMNTKNNPIYLLCFAASNKKGASVALKIAQHILNSK
jgi:three-Cys-motif partner protein